MSASPVLPQAQVFLLPSQPLHLLAISSPSLLATDQAKHSLPQALPTVLLPPSLHAPLPLPALSLTTLALATSSQQVLLAYHALPSPITDNLPSPHLNTMQTITYSM